MNPEQKEYLKEHVKYTDKYLQIGSSYVMHEWERPLITKMVEDLKITSSDEILEIGFGMGISASLIQQFNPANHTIIEPHPQIFKRAQKWKKENNNISLREGYWQQLSYSTPCFSKIFFDPFSDDIDAVDRENIEFLEFASQNLLKKNGRLALFCIHPMLPKHYQLSIFNHYKSLEINVVHVAPQDTDDPTLNKNGKMISVILHK